VGLSLDENDVFISTEYLMVLKIFLVKSLTAGSWMESWTPFNK
jgi:hypothetical protein